MEFSRLEGLDGLLAKLKALPPEIVSKNGGPVRAALAKGARIVQEQAKQNVRAIIAEPNKHGRDNVSTGQLVEHIVVTRARRPKAIDPLSAEVYRVRVKRLAKKYADTKFNRRKKKVGRTYFSEIAHYGAKLEFGTKRGIKAYGWLGNAMRMKQEEAGRVITSELVRRIAAIERKMSAQK